MSSTHPDVERLGSRTPSRAADLLAVWLHPAAVLAVAVLVLGVHASWPRVLVGLGWGLLVLVLAVGLPMGMLLVVLRLGWVSDFHVVRREERVKPLAIGIAMVALATVLAWVLGAPRDLRSFMVALLLGAAVMAVVTLWEKISFHAAGVACATVILALAVSPWWWLAGGACLAAVSWARLRSGRHSGLQVFLGALVGGVVVGGLFSLMR